MTICRLVLATGFIGLALLCGFRAEAETVRVSGSTTVNSLLMTPYKPDIEKAAGVDLAVAPSNSGAGLADLAKGQADIAMISAPFEDVAQRLAASGGGELRAADFRVHELGHAHVVFIVDPANAVTTLTSAQLASILTGQTKNWREVGGKDQPITLIAEQPTGAMRTEIVAKIMGGKDFPDSAGTVTYAVQAVGQVEQIPGSIGFISSALPLRQRGNTNTVKTDAEIVQTLVLVTRANPSPPVQKIVGAAEHVAGTILER